MSTQGKRQDEVESSCISSGEEQKQRRSDISWISISTRSGLPDSEDKDSEFPTSLYSNPTGVPEGASEIPRNAPQAQMSLGQADAWHYHCFSSAAEGSILAVYMNYSPRPYFVICVYGKWDEEGDKTPATYLVAPLPVGLKPKEAHDFVLSAWRLWLERLHIPAEPGEQHIVARADLVAMKGMLTWDEIKAFMERDRSKDEKQEIESAMEG
jgi:hypothetical protein